MTAGIGSTVYTHYYKLVADDVTASVILITAIIIIIFGPSVDIFPREFKN